MFDKPAKFQYRTYPKNMGVAEIEQFCSQAALRKFICPDGTDMYPTTLPRLQDYSSARRNFLCLFL